MSLHESEEERTREQAAFLYCCLFLLCDSLFDFLVDEALLICMTIFTASLFALMRISRKSTVIATEIYGVTLRERRWIDFRGSELFAQTIGGRRTFEKVAIETSESSCFLSIYLFWSWMRGIVMGYVTLSLILLVMTSWVETSLELKLRITFWIANCALHCVLQQMKARASLRYVIRPLLEASNASQWLIPHLQIKISLDFMNIIPNSSRM